MRQHIRPQRVPGWGLAVAAAAALLAAACSGPVAHPTAVSQPQPSATKASPQPSAAPSVSAPARVPTSSAPAPAPTPAAAGTPACATAALTVAAGQENGAAGSIYYPLEFSNTSAAACTLFGYPGVSFVTGIGGGQIGGAATRNPTFPAQVVTLAPGATVHASLQVVVAQDYQASLCKPVTAHWLRIYPPNQTAPLYLSFTAQTCTGKIPSGSTLGIYVVRPGTTGP